MTGWHEKAWGDIAEMGLLESVYIVIEVDCRGFMGYVGIVYWLLMWTTYGFTR